LKLVYPAIEIYLKNVAGLAKGHVFFTRLSCTYTMFSSNYRFKIFAVINLSNASWQLLLLLWGFPALSPLVKEIHGPFRAGQNETFDHLHAIADARLQGRLLLLRPPSQHIINLVTFGKVVPDAEAYP
jgi:hypothetical protein